MSKPTAKKVYDPDEDITHIESWPSADAVTLCQQTDWLHNKKRPEIDTKRPLTCRSCKAIHAFCNSVAMPS